LKPSEKKTSWYHVSQSLGRGKKGKDRGGKVCQKSEKVIKGKGEISGTLNDKKSFWHNFLLTGGGRRGREGKKKGMNGGKRARRSQRNEKELYLKKAKKAKKKKRRGSRWMRVNCGGEINLKLNETKTARERST